MLYADDMLQLLITKSIINLVRTAYSIWILIVLKINLDKSIFKLTVMWSIKFEWFAHLSFKWSIWQNKCKYGKALSFALFSKVALLTIPFSAFKKRYRKKERWKGGMTQNQVYYIYSCRKDWCSLQSHLHMIFIFVMVALSSLLLKNCRRLLKILSEKRKVVSVHS